MLKKKDNLANFLAGSIDGDGSINDSIRLSIRKNSLVYNILSNLDLLGSYDNKRFLVTIRLPKISDILEDICKKVEHPKRKEKITRILKRKRCFKVDYKVNVNITDISQEDLSKILSLYRLERNKSYFYVVYPLRDDILRILMKMLPKEVIKIDPKRKRTRVYKKELVRWLAVHSPTLCH